METKSESALISTRTPSSKAPSLILAVVIAGAAARLCLAAAFELVVRESTGYGDSPNEAIVNALVEAIKESEGIAIEAEKSLRTSLVQTESGEKATTVLNDQIRSRSKGLIRSYDVVGVTNQDQRWIAKLMVTLPQYRPPPPERSNLPSIAVLPFRTKIQAGAELARAWEQKLVTCLVQARQFRVVDRDFTAELDREDARLRSGDTPITELARLGQNVGADYAVVGEITHFDLKSPQGSGLPDEIALTIDYRIIESATREVRGANTASVSYSRDMLEQLRLRTNKGQAQEHILNSSAFWVVTDILDVIHPTKPGTLALRLSPAPEYALYANGMRLSGTSNEFTLPAERELTLQLVAKDYEAAEQKLQLSADGHQTLDVKLNPGPGMILEAAGKVIKPTGYATSNGKHYLSFGPAGLGRRVAEGEKMRIVCQGCTYEVEVAAIDPSQRSYTLNYKGQSTIQKLQPGQPNQASPSPTNTAPPAPPAQQPSVGLAPPSVIWKNTPGFVVMQPVRALDNPKDGPGRSQDWGRSGSDRGRSGSDRGRSGSDRGRSGSDRGRSGYDGRRRFQDERPTPPRPNVPPPPPKGTPPPRQSQP